MECRPYLQILTIWLGTKPLLILFYYSLQPKSPSQKYLMHLRQPSSQQSGKLFILFSQASLKSISWPTPSVIEFKDIIEPEQTFHTWNQLLTGLPAGKLSFLLCIVSDCLPIPLNLCHWRYHICNAYPLCNSSSSTTMHILMDGWKRWSRDASPGTTILSGNEVAIPM